MILGPGIVVCAIVPALNMALCMLGKHSTAVLNTSHLLLFILRQNLPKFPRLPLNLVCSPGRPWILLLQPPERLGLQISRVLSFHLDTLVSVPADMVESWWHGCLREQITRLSTSMHLWSTCLRPYISQRGTLSTSTLPRIRQYSQYWFCLCSGIDNGVNNQIAYLPNDICILDWSWLQWFICFCLFRGRVLHHLDWYWTSNPCTSITWVLGLPCSV